MSSGAAFVTNFCYVSVYLTRKSSVLLFYPYEGTSSGTNKSHHNLASHKLNRPSSFKTSTEPHFLWPLNYFCITFCTLSTYFKIKGVPERLSSVLEQGTSCCADPWSWGHSTQGASSHPISWLRCGSALSKTSWCRNCAQTTFFKLGFSPNFLQVSLEF